MYLIQSSNRLCALIVAAGIYCLPGNSWCYEPPVPEVSVNGATATVSWQGKGTLYRSHLLANDWSVVGSASSPYMESVAGVSKRFFRVVYDTSNYIPVDTNQVVHYDNAGAEIDPAPTEGQAYYGQDARYVVNAPSYTDNGDGTVTDHNTGLIWQKTPPEAFYSWTEAQSYADNLVLGGESDWRLPTIKELVSLADFNGSSRAQIDLPYIDATVFDLHDPLLVTTFVPAGASSTKRDIDGQFWSSTAYVGRTINNDSATFGYNFIDGRIKAYPDGLVSGPTGTAFVRCVRGSTNYGQNNLIDNGDGTITDLATGLMWLQNDSGAYPAAGSQGNGTLNWSEALAWAEGLEHAGYDDWVLPDAKQLHTIVDYTRAPDAANVAHQTAAIDPVFNITETESWFWSSTSLGDDLFAWGVYVAFGQALAIDQTTLLPTVNAHGAGAMRSDPKTGDPSTYANGHGPQFDQVRIFNYARPVRQAFAVTPPKPPASFTVAISGSTSAPADLGELPTSVTFNGLAVDLATVSRPSQQELSFDYVIYGLPPGDYAVEAVFASGVQTGTHTIHANTLLMIVDDWGVDASPLDNTEPGALLANMPHLTTLASEGLRFTRAYSQPTCSPTRATIMTGRQPWQHNVGVPENAGNFSTAEITLPEIFATMGAPYRLMSVGKWHLGGNNNGYSSRGGWPEFYGINGGGVGNYTSWDKNSNGSVATSSTYTTTDQVNEAKTFIDTRASNGEPWFAWVAFNAPHSPFHDPPADLAPVGGYSAQGGSESATSHQYRKMLEALDTEIGRLLKSVDPAQTNIIVIGDNGTPGQVVQAPYGNGHAKGSLFSGGNHVPLIVKGPAVTVASGSTTNKLVHCADLFSTILELSGIDQSMVPNLAAQNVASTSIVPILNGTDTADRCVIVESHSSNGSGRAIVVDDYPDYRLYIFNDLSEPLDSPVYAFYNTSTDVNEQSPLDIGSLTGQALDAYNACVAKDAALGGGYSDEPASGFDTLYIQLPDTGVTPSVPNLTQGNGNTISVVSVTVDGNPATVIGRIGSGTLLNDETDDVAERYWVKVRIAPANGGPYTTAHVVFPDQPAGQGGAAREYDFVSILVNPHP